jgi:membrane protein YdbS with pleckstrin-like domain
VDPVPTAPPDTVVSDVAAPLVEGWRPLSPAAAAVRAIAGALSGVLMSIVAAAILLAALRLGMVLGLGLVLAATLTGAATGAWLGRLRWKKTRWKLDAIGLHVRRGLLWHTDVLVPRSRVQHLDIERGPLERQFTLATLVVHTAGTDTHALRLSGLDETDAVTLRDALIPDVARHVDAL